MARRQGARNQMKGLKASVILFLALGLWVALAGGITLYIDYLWFDSLGFLSVFATEWRSRSLYGLIGLAVSLGIFASSLWLASRTARGHYWIRHELVEMARQGARYLLWGAALVFSLFASLSTQAQWLSFLQFQKATSVGISDPIFDKDLAFYFFTLPVFHFGLRFLLAVLTLSLILTAGSYVINGHLGYVGGLQLSSEARRHLSFLLGSIFGLLGIYFWLKRFELLYNQGGVVFGAGYTDIHAWLPCYWILVVLSILTSLLIWVSMVSRTTRPALMAAGGFALIYLLTNIYPPLIQTLAVEPNQLQRETPYIENNIGFTLQAYNLDQIEVREFAARATLQDSDLDKNRGTLRNIRLWDWRTLQKTYEQLQSIRPYYTFHDVDLDRYVIDGNYRQVMLSARELDFSKISPQAQTWINQYFQYTHGYGLCLSLVNEVTREGLPQFVIKDIPPASSVNLPVSRPEIYFGERTDYPVFVRTTMKEFDYPIGDRNADTIYHADRGIWIGSFFRKLLFAWELKSYQILLTEHFTDDSRVLLHRRIQERVARIAPFLRYDKDPYLVIHEGRLFWIQDAFTLTDRYPYAEPFEGKFNYIRNAVKVVVDAYLGDVTFYVFDPEDPLIGTYRKIFPQLFRPLEQMPSSLRSHVRYPTDLFDIQRDLLGTYHMKDPRVFYNKEDLWEVPNEIYGDDEQLMESYYVIMSLPGSEREEFIQLVPFTPKNKDNMIAWMAARSDGEHYGKLLLYQFPKQELTYGPMQIEARIDQDPNISQLITLWGQKGSQVIRGNLLVIPIEESLLYVEPLYLQAEKSNIPELTRVTSVYENRVALGTTLQEALQQAIFGSGRADRRLTDPTVEPVDTTDPANSGLLVQAWKHFRNSQEFLRRGDWTSYGQEQQQLGEILRRLSGNAPRPSP